MTAPDLIFIAVGTIWAAAIAFTVWWAAWDCITNAQIGEHND